MRNRVTAVTQPSVSILTGSEEPVQRNRPRGLLRLDSGFNPHRLRRAGATSKHCPIRAALVVSILTGSEEPVQQHSARTGQPLYRRFQSSPAPKSRCNAVGFCEGTAVQEVSILTGSEEPVQHKKLTERNIVTRVSILTGSEEPVQRAARRTYSQGPRFNPHRLRRAGATLQWMKYSQH